MDILRGIDQGYAGGLNTKAENETASEEVGTWSHGECGCCSDTRNDLCVSLPGESHVFNLD